jgi:hypothetical protein
VCGGIVIITGTLLIAIGMISAAAMLFNEAFPLLNLCN